MVQDIRLSLSGGTWLYVKSQKGVMPMMAKDLHRLKLETVQLWNGEELTNLLGMSKSGRTGNEIEFLLQSGGEFLVPLRMNFLLAEN